jgi:hypothetical protein
VLDFLRSLAPQNLDAKSSAVGALPSRFEIDQPLRVTPAASMPAAISDEPRTDSQPALPQPTHLAPLDEREDNRRVHGRDVRVDVEPRRTEYDRSRTEARPSSDAARVPAASVDAMTRRVTEVPTLRERPTSPNEIGPTLPPRVPRVAAPVREAIAIPAMARPPSTPQTNTTPLSPHVVAARVTTRGESRPVVHVTIDRVDVRVPSSTERSKPLPRRPSPSSPSLSDYLRSRQSDRRGGRS